MTDIETIREALETANMRLTAHGDNNTTWLREAVHALNRINGRCLPELPQGWHYYDCNSSSHHGVIVGLMFWSGRAGTKQDGWKEPDVVRGEGTTFRAAVLSAIEKIGRDE